MVENKDIVHCAFILIKVMRDAEVIARGTVLFMSTQLIAYGENVDVMGKTNCLHSGCRGTTEPISAPTIFSLDRSDS